MSEPVIPFFDPRYENEILRKALNEAFQDTIRSGRFILGPTVRAFEEEIAQYLNVKHAIGLNSGTDALAIGLRSLGIRPGDEVITTPFSFFATTEAILAVGAVPVFVDIDPQTYNIDHRKIEEKISPKTRAILPVHLFGCPADMASILKHNLIVLEDAAQAFGAKLGNQKIGAMGNAGAFSFFPTKILGGYGDGGMIVTDDNSVAETAKMLRVHGARTKYHNEQMGYNSRLDAMQAALLRIKLPYIDEWINKRQTVAHRYSEMLADQDEIITPPEMPDAVHVFNSYTIRVPQTKRDPVIQTMKENGVSVQIYYPVPIHKLPIFSKSPSCDLPNSEQIASQVLSLPMWPHMDEAMQTKIVQTLKAAVAHA